MGLKVLVEVPEVVTRVSVVVFPCLSVDSVLTSDEERKSPVTTGFNHQRRL